MEHEIVPADKRQRRLTIVAVVLLFLGGLVGLAGLRWHLGRLEQLVEEHPRQAVEKALRLVGVFAWVGGLSFLGAGAWLWRLGRRINRAGRFPPPGMKVVRDTRVRTAAGARTVASLAEVAALVCVVAGTLGMWYVYRLAVTLLRQ